MSSVACRFPLVAVVGIAFEEVVVQCIADFQQHVTINPTVFEDAIHILARALQLRSKPCDGAPLAGQFRLDEVSDMWGFERGHGFKVLDTKKAWNQFLA